MNYIKTPNSQQLPAPPEDGPDPVKELAHEWLDVMHSDPDYTEEALGDSPLILDAIYSELHMLTYSCDTHFETVFRAEVLAAHVARAIAEYADAKAESGEQLP